MKINFQILFLFCFNTFFINSDYTVDFLGLKATPSILLYISTSPTTYSGTENSIYASFYGSFASSGPHDIGNFEVGTIVSKNITLFRDIGDLKAVTLFNNQTDGWLLSNFECDLADVHYKFSFPKQWLDTIDSNLLTQYKNGYEPFSQEHQIPGSSTLRLVVESHYIIYPIDGIYVNKYIKS